MTPLLSEPGPQRAAQRSNRPFPVRGHCFCFSSSQIIGLPASLSHSKVCVLTRSCFGDGFGSGFNHFQKQFWALDFLPRALSTAGCSRKDLRQNLIARGWVSLKKCSPGPRLKTPLFLIFLV